MSFSKENRPHTLHGILFVALFALVATYVADWPFLKRMAISPLIIGIVLGMFYANTLRMHLPKEWTPGIFFSSKVLLRAGIIFFGFKVTFQQVLGVGAAGIVSALSVVTLTLLLGYVIGVKVLKLDRETAVLTSSGSAICGAAAVLATEGVLKSESYKSAVAVGTVVLFGTTSMFLYPLIYRMGFIPFGLNSEGIYIGSSVHEVAQVVGAGSAISPETAATAVIVKMIRIMLLVPFLLILSVLMKRIKSSRNGAVAVSSAQVAGAQGSAPSSEQSKITIPWFAVWFLVVAGFNSLDIVPHAVVGWIKTMDTFVLTMAMTALGMETGLDKFKGIGGRAVFLAFILFLWLNVGGYFITSLAVRL